MKINLFGLFVPEIAEAIVPYGLEKYRARQIASWIYGRSVRDFTNMTNLSKEKRKILDDYFVIETPILQTTLQSQDGKTSKFLLEFSDGQTAETVLMRHPYGNSVCVSTQVGCNMGCLFCASTLTGMKRNLQGGEIFAQVLFCNDMLVKENGRVSSIVIMGSGEPLANYDNVMRFINLCHEPYSLNLGYRNFTLSTSGLVPEIKRLAEEKLPLTLAISLHAPNNDLRSHLMPINRRYPLSEVLIAADYYAEITGRRVTYEYILLAGTNDQPQHANELVKLLRGRLANVNLIPANAVPERGLLRPSDRQVAIFEEILRNAQINVTVRREMGADIQAACGQLRNKVLAEREKAGQ